MDCTRGIKTHGLAVYLLILLIRVHIIVYSYTRTHIRAQVFFETGWSKPIFSLSWNVNLYLFNFLIFGHKQFLHTLYLYKYMYVYKQQKRRGVITWIETPFEKNGKHNWCTGITRHWKFLCIHFFLKTIRDGSYQQTHELPWFFRKN